MGNAIMKLCGNKYWIVKCMVAGYFVGIELSIVLNICIVRCRKLNCLESHSHQTRMRLWPLKTPTAQLLLEANYKGPMLTYEYYYTE